MPGKRFKAEEIVNTLRQADVRRRQLDDPARQRPFVVAHPRREPLLRDTFYIAPTCVKFVRGTTGMKGRFLQALSIRIRLIMHHLQPKMLVFEAPKAVATRSARRGCSTLKIEPETL